jgi:hypothetical protein
MRSFDKLQYAQNDGNCSSVAFIYILLLSSYEKWESIGFTSGQKQNLLFFTFKDLYLYLKNMFRAKKNFRLSRGIGIISKALKIFKKTI